MMFKKNLPQLFKIITIAVFNIFIADSIFAQQPVGVTGKKNNLLPISYSALPLASTPGQKPTVSDKDGIKKPARELLFTENKGQLADEKGRMRPDILFTASSKGTSLFIGAGELTYQFQKEVFPEGYVRDMRKAKDTSLQAMLEKKIKRETYRFTLSLAGANRSPVIIKEEQNICTENFYLSNCPEGITGVHNFGRLTMKDIYPGIDWVLYSKKGSFVYDFIVHPGSDPSLIRLSIKDAKKTYISAAGELIFKTSLGTVRESVPVSFCNKEKIPTAFHKNEDGTISFSINTYDKNKDLVIDPVVNWSTYYGGTGDDYGLSLATDLMGNIYESGQTTSVASIASGGGYQTTLGGSIDAYLVKFNSSGARLWATYYGGSGNDWAYGCSTDASNNVFICGYTSSASGIASGGYQLFYGGGTYDAYVVKFNSSGTRLWSSYYGGSGTEYSYHCPVDAAGNVYISGATSSTSNIAVSGYQNSYGGGTSDAFLAKFSSSGGRIWATYFGGGNYDYGFNSSVDASDNVVLIATTSSPGLTSGGYQTTYGGGTSDACIVKFNSSGGFLWSSYYGGPGPEDGYFGCDFDASGNIYMAGNTGSANNIASGGAHQTTYGGGVLDAYLVKFSSSGGRVWGTYFGGSGDDYGRYCCTDAIGNVYLTGVTGSSTGIASGGFQNVYSGGYDGYITKFNAGGTMIWGSYFGGSGFDESDRCIWENTGYLYMSGGTGSAGLVSGGYQTTYGGGVYDGFLAKITDAGTTVTVSSTVLCAGGTVNVNYTANGAFGGGNVFTAELSNSVGSFASPVVIGSVTATGSGTIVATIPGGTLAGTGYRVRITSTNPATIGANNGADITINAASSSSVSIAITAGSQTICAGTSVTFTATPTNGGTTPAYQWKINGVNAGTNAATFTSTTLANNDIVTVVMTSNASCVSPATATSNSIQMTVSSSLVPSVSIAITVGSQTICTGTSVTFTATPTNGGTTPAYQWKVNGVNAGTNSTTFTSTTLANNDIVTVVMTSNASCVSPATATSNSIQMTVSSSLVPSVSIAITVGSQTICTGTSVTFTATPTNGGTTPAYQWKINGVNAGTNAATFTSTTLANNDIVTVVMTSNASCVSPATATSNSIQMTVSSSLVPSVSIAITVGSQTICTGTSVTFTATPTNGGTTPAYQWKINGVNAGTNAATFTSTTLANNDIVTVVMTSNASCVSPATATSNSIQMTVSTSLVPSVSIAITVGSQTICTGTSVTFTATPTNGGTTPAYQWKINGVNAGTNAATFTSTTLANNDIVTVVMTSNAGCVSPPTATSNSIQMTVSSSLVPSVNIAITVGSQTICTGTSVTFTATPTNGGTTPAYQWKINGVNAGTNAATFTSTTLANNDIVTVVMTSNASCVSPATATSNSIQMTVSSSLVPSVSIAITVGSQTICTGTSVTFTATPTNGGTTPAYQWKVNGINAGTNAATFTSTILANNDIVTVVMTSNASCVSPATATSSGIQMTVSSSLAPSVSIAITVGSQTICTGTSVTFTATPTNGGTTPAYQWKVNGINAGTNAATFTSTILANNDIVTVVMTSNASCVSPATATSNGIQMTVTSSVSASVSIAITSGSQTICTGTSVTFTATPTNGGTTPAYQWKVNGINAGTNAATFTSTILANNDIVTVVMTSNAGCVSPATATSNGIQMTVTSSVSASVSIAITSGSQTICTGTSVTFAATPTNGGAAPAYQWKVNAVNAGTNSTTFTSATLANNDIVTVVMTSNASCVSPATATSNSIQMTVNPMLNPSVSIAITTGSQTICAGTSVTFTATPVNGGTTPAYQWKVNGVNAGSNSTTFTSATLSNNDAVTVVITSNAGCLASNNPASNPITMTVNPNLTPSVSIAITSGNQTICAGTSVTFTATPVNGGATPVYQWKVNGVNAGTSSPAFTSTTLANNDAVTVVLTSNATCLASNNPVSNSITMTVNPNLTPVISIAITSGSQTICARSSVTFTATQTNGGTVPAYQWQINGVNAGTNSPVFTSSSLANNDAVTVILTSNETCLAGNNMISNPIVMTVNPNLTPAVSIAITSGSQTICAGASVTFTAIPTNGGPAPSYQWKINGVNAGTNSAIFTLNSLANNDIVSVVLTSNAICLLSNNPVSNSITMTVNPLLTPLVSIVADKTIICQGSTGRFMATPTNGGTAPSYQWKVNGVNTGTNSAVFILTTPVNNDVISCVLTTSEICYTSPTAISNAITITVAPLPVIAVSSNTEILEGGVTQLNSSSSLPVSYNWTPSFSLNNSTIANPIALPNATTLYQLEATTAFGCKGYGTVQVKVVPGPQIANTFTPNSDGINDNWEIRNLNTFPNCRIQVFTRTGQLIFESKGYSKPWDGNYKGKPLPVDTYYYILEPNNRFISAPITGYVTIIK